MIAACDNAMNEIGAGLAASLRGVDCLSGQMAEQAFSRLFGGEGQLGPALTIMLTLFIALFGYALITGRSSVSVRSLMPRMVTLGLVVTFATSWLAFQTVVWNIALGAPDEIAGAITGSDGPATLVFADKIDIVFNAIAQIADGTNSGGQGAAAATSMFSPPGLLWIGAVLFLLGTVGVLVTSRIALAVLVALGPIFVVMALFNGTRGLFVGWLKGLVMLSVAPLLAVLAGSLMLEMTIPIINALQTFPGQIDPRAAFAFFLVGFVHVTLMILALKTASAMVSGWRVFGLADKVDMRGGSMATQPATVIAPAAQLAQANSANAALASARRTEIAGMTAMVAANDQSAGGASTQRETRIVTTQGEKPASPETSGPSRARGIGSRFRAAPQRPSESIK